MFLFTHSFLLITLFTLTTRTTPSCHLFSSLHQGDPSIYTNSIKPTVFAFCIVSVIRSSSHNGQDQSNTRRNLLDSVNTQVIASVLSMNYSLYLKDPMGVSVTEYINMKGCC